MQLITPQERQARLFLAAFCELTPRQRFCWSLAIRIYRAGLPWLAIPQLGAFLSAITDPGKPWLWFATSGAAAVLLTAARLSV